MIHIHSDVDGLKYFSDKNGVCAYSNRAVAYAMQNEHIVGLFYTEKQAKDFYEQHKHTCISGKLLPILFYWDESRWDKIHKKNE
jgi:hypothetical protein